MTYKTIDIDVKKPNGVVINNRQKTVNHFDFKLKNNSTVLTLDMYDYIDDWGINSRNVSEAIKMSGPIEKIVANINSPGGDAFEGIAIHNLLVSSGLEIETNVMGVAASAASIIAMAGNVRNVYENTFIMIHNSSTFANGSAKDFEHLAAIMNKLDIALGSAYVNRTGIDAKQIRSMMDAETWLDGNESVEKGFATNLIKTESKDVEAVKNWDLSGYKNTPDFLKRGANDKENNRNEFINLLLSCDDSEFKKAKNAFLAFNDDALKSLEALNADLKNRINQLRG